jgi:hypothetical protein
MVENYALKLIFKTRKIFFSIFFFLAYGEASAAGQCFSRFFFWPFFFGQFLSLFLSLPNRYLFSADFFRQIFFSIFGLS